ncbi:MAG: COQ9 family protein, partial [Proteobacteria bacterium]|nr:COQ9 family protein [Pseudomonadota bacterium]
MKREPSKSALIAAALRQMAVEGWMEAALAKAEAAEGWAPGTYRAYFPAGLADFNREFHLWVDEGMRGLLAKQPDFEAAKIREKIFRCVMARLQVLLPHRTAVQRFISHQLMPWNAARGIAGLGRAANVMWKAAGDRSIDYNYYTKRVLLSGVYAATL